MRRQTTRCMLQVLALLCVAHLSLNGKTLESVLHLKPEQKLNGMLEASFRVSLTDEEVKRYVENYTVRGRHETAKILGRAFEYFPVFETYLKKEGVPEALKYLPIVESALYLDIESSAGAKGLWQFMPVTARHYGLQVDEERDERHDLHRSSEAAAAMLSDLHRQFCDWFLVLAAYNCGPGRVKRAIRKAGSHEFSRIKPLLPKQTQQYIAKFQAAAYVANHYHRYNILPRIVHLPHAERISIRTTLTVQQLAEVSGLSLQTICTYNPQIKTTSSFVKKGTQLFLPAVALQRIQQFNMAIVTTDHSREVPDSPVCQLTSFFKHKQLLFPASAPAFPTRTVEVRKQFAVSRRNYFA